MYANEQDLEKILVSTEQIKTRVKELADQISTDYANVDQIFLIGILKGAFIFLADLCRELKIPHVVDFMAVSSYGKTANTGAVRVNHGFERTDRWSARHYRGRYC